MNNEEEIIKASQALALSAVAISTIAEPTISSEVLERVIANAKRLLQII